MACSVGVRLGCLGPQRAGARGGSAAALRHSTHPPSPEQPACPTFHQPAACSRQLATRHRYKPTRALSPRIAGGPQATTPTLRAPAATRIALATPTPPRHAPQHSALLQLTRMLQGYIAYIVKLKTADLLFLFTRLVACVA